MQRTTIQRLSLSLFVLTLLWGTYTTLVYYGILVHGKVLMTTDAQAAVQTACPDVMSFVCRGAHALLPSLTHSIGRLSPFLPYAIVSLLAYLLYIGWQTLKHGYAPRRFQWRPRTIAGLFFVSIWLFFTVLSNATIDYPNEKGVSLGRIVEPHPSVYSNVGPEGLEVLRDNFTRLLRKDCLEFTRQARPEVRIFELKNSCMQTFFFKRTVPQIIFLSLLILTFLTTGRMILNALRFRFNRVLVETVLSFGLGACAWSMLLWIFGVAHILTKPVGWLAILVILGAGYKHAKHWMLLFWNHRWEVDRSWKSPMILIAWLLLSLCALNFLTVIRPFPIGWDDLGSYLNRPRLLVSFGHYIFSMPSFQWEYVTSLAYLLYGYDSIFASTAAMLINWLAGPFAFLVVVIVVQTFMGPGTGLLAGFLYYLLPLVGHFSFADMKTDNAVFALQALSLFCVLCALFLNKEEDEDHKEPPWQWWILTGIFAGFAFSTKATAAMTILAIGMLTLGNILHWTAGLGVVLLSVPVYTRIQKVVDLGAFLERVAWGSLSPSLVMGACTVAGLACIGYGAFRNKGACKQAIRACGILIAGCFLIIGPWVAHNNILHKDFGLHLGAPNTVSPVFDRTGTQELPKYDAPVKRLPPELQIDENHPACKGTAREEELGRYWGYRTGWGHYLKLPWRTVMNLDSAGYYVTTSPSLLLFPLLLLLPAFWLAGAAWLRWLAAATAFLVAQWAVLANGVPWYGIAMLLGPLVALEVFILKAPDKLNRIAMSIMLALGIISCLAMRTWQFEQQRNLLEYPMGKASALTMRERTIPHYNNITDEVVSRSKSMPDRPYLYRIGTFIPYFIPKNLEVIGMHDHQVDFFNCLHQERDNALTLRRLQALGFNSIIFDTNTATIERDPNGSLHKKVEQLVLFLNDKTLGLRILVNDSQAGVVFITLP